MISTQTLKGNLVLQDYTTAFTLNQGDKGVPFKIELIDNGTPYTLLSTDTVSIEWYKPNGSPFLQEGNIKYGTNYIEITTPEAIAQYSGSGTFNIIISDGTVRKGTIRREYKVIPTSMKPGSVSEDTITDAITELRELNSTLTATIQTGNLDNYAKKTYVDKEVDLINSSLEDIAKEIGEIQITDLTGGTLNLNIIDITYTGKNLFNKDTVTEGYYIHTSTGLPVVKDGYGYSERITILPNKSVVISDINHVVFFASDGTITGTLLQADKTCVVPSNTSYAIVSVNLTYKDTAQLEYGTTSTAYEKYSKVYRVKESALHPKSRGIYDIIVDKNGNGDYTTITEAVENAVSNQSIFIKNGNYDNEGIEAWTKDLNIIGESKEGVIISNSLDDYDIPPLEMCSGLLENVTVHAIYSGTSGSKSAYALHCEHGNMVDKTFIIKNCSFISDKNYAIGMGLRKNCKVTIENCEIINDAGGLFFHDSYQTAYVGTQNITVKGCKICSNQVGRVPLRIQSQQMAGNTVNIEFINNAVYNKYDNSMPVNAYNNDGTTGLGTGWQNLDNFILSGLSYGNQATILNS